MRRHVLASRLVATQQRVTWRRPHDDFFAWRSASRGGVLPAAPLRTAARTQRRYSPRLRHVPPASGPVHGHWQARASSPWHPGTSDGCVVEVVVVVGTVVVEDEVEDDDVLVVGGSVLDDDVVVVGTSVVVDELVVDTRVDVVVVV